MFRALHVLQMKEDVLKFLEAGTHLGGTNLDFQMEQFNYKRKTEGTYIINLKRTWKMFLLAVCAIVAIENPADDSVTLLMNTIQKAVLKFDDATGDTHCWLLHSCNLHLPDLGSLPGAETSGTDLRTDRHPLTEAYYVNVPTIFLCYTESTLH
nr:40S ribosomal protein SA-like [Equus caballus]